MTNDSEHDGEWVITIVSGNKHDHVIMNMVESDGDYDSEW